MSLQRNWRLTRQALDGLLRRLDEKPEAAAREYEDIRKRLISFFSLRRIHPADGLADETIDRVARRLEEGEPIEHVRAYFHGVAHRVALEQSTRQRREGMAIARQPSPPAVSPEALEAAEARTDCLASCLRSLPPESRALIVGYYRTGRLSLRDGRKLLAERLGISYATLKVRAFRIRRQLEGCLRDCLRSRRSKP